MKSPHWKNTSWNWLSAWPLAIALSGLFVGCERKEKVLDVETPGGGVEINKSQDGSLEVEVKEDHSNDSHDRVPSENQE